MTDDILSTIHGKHIVTAVANLPDPHSATDEPHHVEVKLAQPDRL